jgi:hypothetical protein
MLFQSISLNIVPCQLAERKGSCHLGLLISRLWSWGVVAAVAGDVVILFLGYQSAIMKEGC